MPVSCINFTTSTLTNWVVLSLNSSNSASGITPDLTTVSKISTWTWSSGTTAFWIASNYAVSSYYTYTDTLTDPYCAKFLTVVPSDVYYNDPANTGTSMLTTFTVQTCDGQTLPVTGITRSDGSTFSDPNFVLSGGNMTITIASSSAFESYIGSFGIRLTVNYYN